MSESISELQDQIGAGIQQYEESDGIIAGAADAIEQSASHFEESLRLAQEASRHYQLGITAVNGTIEAATTRARETAEAGLDTVSRAAQGSRHEANVVGAGKAYIERILKMQGVASYLGGTLGDDAPGLEQAVKTLERLATKGREQAQRVAETRQAGQAARDAADAMRQAL